MVEQRRILLGVTGGIAAYKTPELVRELSGRGARVRAVVTKAAQRFVSPLTLEVLTGHPVGTSLWDTVAEGSGAEIHHTSAGQQADAIVVAPASANFIARLACGMADDLLSCILLASKVPVLLCPSMNTNMWENPLFEANLNRLAALPRFHVLPPDSGELACKVVGAGRLPDIARIADAVEGLWVPQDLAQRHITITAGPTREHLDPVRFLSNPSTGRMGVELARAAWRRGAQVTLIHGPLALAVPAGVRSIAAHSAVEMAAAVDAEMDTSEVLIMAAAVADWQPADRSERKVKKHDGDTTVRLVRTPDILMSQRERRDVVRVGFAAETHDLLANAQSKLEAKSLDMIVANCVNEDSSATGFAAQTNAGWLVRPGRDPLEVPVCSKAEFASRVLDGVAGLLMERGQ